MSLLSLRKTNLQSQTTKHYQRNNANIDTESFAEAFIEQANHYANGRVDNVIPFQNNNSSMVDLKRANKKQPYRRATFTLSETCIEALNQHANKQQCAKSHLVRMLVRYFNQLTSEQQKAILEQQKDQK